jgi:phage shock protein E
MEVHMKRRARLAVLACLMDIAFYPVLAEPAISRRSAKYIDPAQLAALIDGKAETYFLVDVRTKEEYEAGHIRSAINIPVDQIATEPPTTDKDALILVYCRSGRRSAAAATALENLGYRNIVDFGGVSRWPGGLVAGPKPDKGP